MKKCRKCDIEKTLEEFYRHAQMADGHLNICKECTRKRIHEYWKDGRGKIVDRRRGQKQERRDWHRVYAKKMRMKYKRERSCRVKFWNEFKKGTIERLPCQVCGTKKFVEAHHSDYDKPFEVMWLCSNHHKEWHRNNEALNQSESN